MKHTQKLRWVPRAGLAAALGLGLMLPAARAQSDNLPPLPNFALPAAGKALPAAQNALATLGTIFQKINEAEKKDAARLAAAEKQDAARTEWTSTDDDTFQKESQEIDDLRQQLVRFEALANGAREPKTRYDSLLDATIAERHLDFAHDEHQKKHILAAAIHLERAKGQLKVSYDLYMKAQAARPKPRNQEWNRVLQKIYESDLRLVADCKKQAAQIQESLANCTGPDPDRSRARIEEANSLLAQADKLLESKLTNEASQACFAAQIKLGGACTACGQPDYYDVALQRQQATGSR